MIIRNELHIFNNSEDLIKLYTDTILSIGSNSKYSVEITTNNKEGFYFLMIKISKPDTVTAIEGYDFSIN